MAKIVFQKIWEPTTFKSQVQLYSTFGFCALFSPSLHGLWLDMFSRPLKGWCAEPMGLSQESFQEVERNFKKDAPPKPYGLIANAPVKLPSNPTGSRIVFQTSFFKGYVKLQGCGKNLVETFHVDKNLPSPPTKAKGSPKIPMQTAG